MRVVDNNIYIKRFNYFNIYVIRGIDGDILIDSGFIGMRRSLKKFLDKFNIKLIVLTHAHVDHTWNVCYLKKLYNCEVLMGRLDVINIDNTNVKSKASKKKYCIWAKLMNLGMKLFKQEKFEPDILIDKDMYYKACGLRFKIVTLSGHTNGSIGLLYNKYLFAGDALVNRKSYVEVAYQNQNNTLAKKTFQKIVKLRPKIVFIGHDCAIKLKKLIKSYEKTK